MWTYGTAARNSKHCCAKPASFYGSRGGRRAATFRFLVCVSAAVGFPRTLVVTCPLVFVLFMCSSDFLSCAPCLPTSPVAAKVSPCVASLFLCSFFFFACAVWCCVCFSLFLVCFSLSLLSLFFFSFFVFFFCYFLLWFALCLRTCSFVLPIFVVVVFIFWLPSWFVFVASRYNACLSGAIVYSPE